MKRRSRSTRVGITRLILSGTMTIKEVANILGVHPVRARKIALDTIQAAHKANGIRGERGWPWLSDIYGRGNVNIKFFKERLPEITPILHNYLQE